MPTAEVRLKKFISPTQQGQPVRWPGGITTTVSSRGHDIRIELHAVGAAAIPILEAMKNYLPKGEGMG